MSTSNANNSPQAQLNALKKAIQAEVHRRTGRKPPILSTNAIFQNLITYNTLEPNNAWYIVPNARNSNKIIQLYKKSTLNQILSNPMSAQRKSPYTSRPITRANIRKYMNFNSSVAPAVINLTRNNHQHRSTASLRTRHGMFSEDFVQQSLKRLMARSEIGAEYKIKTAMRTRLRDKTHFFIRKTSSQGYVFMPGEGSLVGSVSATDSTFIEKLLEYVTHNTAVSADDIRYVGYRSVT